MEYARLGNTGLKVSRICLGCMSYGDPSWDKWILPKDEGVAHIKKALAAGINFFDTADIYSNGQSEVTLGEALKGVPRETVVVATKCFAPMTPGPNGKGLSRKHIFEALEASLKRLQMSYVDLYQIHKWDDETPIEETMKALHDLVAAGKILYIGASTMSAWQFAKAQFIAEKNGWTKFICMQNHYNLVYREEEREMIPFCIDNGVGCIAWSPLARGLLTGTRKRGTDSSQESTRSKNDAYASIVNSYFLESDWDIVDRVVELAGKLGVPAAQVALAWLLHKPGVVSPIVGCTKAHHLDDAIGSLKVKLTTDQMKFLEEKYVPHKMLPWN